MRTPAARAGALLGLAVLVLCGALPPGAYATQSVSFKAALTPERLGHSTTIELAFAIASPADRVPAPLTGVELSYPAHFGIATSGLGLSTCTPAVLEVQGPEGCAPDSQMGYGSALAEVQIGAEILRESVSTSIFMAPIENGNITLLMFVEGRAPVFTQFVLGGQLLPAPPPFGGTLAIAVPLVQSAPGDPDAAVVRLKSTIGPRGITYFRRRHGRLVAYRPMGILLPNRCPHGGFPFAATFTFADGTSTSAPAAVRCPRRGRRRGRHRGR